MRYLFFFIGLIFFSCGSETVHTPKPRSFPRIVLPEKGYQAFDTAFCSFTFQYPKYATINQDTQRIGGKEDVPKSGCWFNITMPDLNATIYCSYYPITPKSTFTQLREDAHRLASEHNRKADYIDELPIQNAKARVAGMVYDIEGAAASPFQFYLTDSTRHFLRGSVYFNAQARPDSLAPMIEFVKKDVIELVNSFQWKGN